MALQLSRVNLAWKKVVVTAALRAFQICICCVLGSDLHKCPQESTDRLHGSRGQPVRCEQKLKLFDHRLLVGSESFLHAACDRYPLRAYYSCSGQPLRYYLLMSVQACLLLIQKVQEFACLSFLFHSKNENLLVN